MEEKEKPLDFIELFFDLLCIVYIAISNLYLLYFGWKIRFRFVSVISQIVNEIKLTGDLTGTNRENFAYVGLIFLILLVDTYALTTPIDMSKTVMTIKYYYCKFFSR